MPITRTPIVNDDGSGTIGTVFENAWKTELYNQIDALVNGVIAGGAKATVITNGQTGTLNDWAIAGRGRTTVVVWTGAGPANVGGIAGGQIGDLLTLKNATANQVMVFYHAVASSALGNRFLNIVSSSTTPIASMGWASFVYDGNQWLMIDHNQGIWLTAAFNAANFTGNGAMTFVLEAADRGDSRYRLVGAGLEYQFLIGAATVGGTVNTTLQIGNGEFGGFRLSPTGGYQRLGFHNLPSPIDVYVSGQDTAIALQLVAGGNWGLGTNNLYVYGGWRGPVL